MRRKARVTASFAIAAALVPAAASVSAASATIDQVVIVKNGQHLSISRSLFTAAVTEKYLSSRDIQVLGLSNGKYYEKRFYDAALLEFGNINAANDYLASSNLDTNTAITPGEFVNGQLVPTSCEGTEFMVCGIE